MHGYPLNRSLNRACINKQDNWQMKIFHTQEALSYIGRKTYEIIKEA